jgi:FlaA1/EpsC-like NDP-sugar epimerase
MAKLNLSKLRGALGRIGRARSWASPAAPDLSDLLGRKTVKLDTPELQRFLAGKNVLITGAGGSIGSEICRQSMKFCPRRIILLDQAENNLFEIDRELRHRWVGAEIVPVVADISDATRIARVFDEHRPQVVFHCAAHKHVPMMELNPGEAIKNNVLGTRVVADAALAAGSAAFVMVSTDKAVNPTSVMGAAKRCAELYIQSLNGDADMPRAGDRNRDGNLNRDDGGRESALPRAGENSRTTTRFVAVRFGNVLGSSGSVVPIFRKQIEAGGPVTVTHPEMKRYFMTIAEASQLVMQAGAIGQGGEIFILDMGEPIQILELAEEMICRYGLKPGDDIAIEFTGIRPGEKLYEELACADEQTRPTSHPKIRVWQLPRATRQQVDRMLEILSAAIDVDRTQVVAALRECVAEYTPDGDQSGKSSQPKPSPTPLRIVADAA